MADLTDKDVITDDDADTRETDDDTKNDEAQVVEDTDADTKDVDRSLDEVISKIDTLEDLISAKFDDVAKLFISSGATVTEAPPVIETNENNEEDAKRLEDLDYSL